MGVSEQDIRFHFRGATVAVRGLPVTTTVLHWLRREARACGTKEGCAEGDCGACTVIVGELAHGPAVCGAVRVGDLDFRPVNACIRFLPTLHGKVLLTIEDLRAMAGGAPHPVQQAMVDCHASQCGFCTPGFAMSLFALYLGHGSAPSRPAIADHLAGNLCRCTGYRPILDAAERMFSLPRIPFDPAPVEAALREIATEGIPDFTYAAPDPASGGQIAHYHAPRTAAALGTLRLAKPQARLLAGATDIGLWVNKQFRDLGDLVAVNEVAELRAIERTENRLSIGAAVPLEDAWAALGDLAPGCREMTLRFAGPPIRHAGTMGGNVANGSPIGDAPPVLMALDAVLVLQRGNAIRRLPIADFYLDYMRNALEQGEFLRTIEIPIPDTALRFRAYKLSKRHDCDISALSLGAAVTLAAGRVATIRLAFGGMAATVRRAAVTESALLGKPWDEPAIAEAQEALAAEFAPLSDLRASAGYRMRAAGNLLRRFHLETRETAPLPASALRARCLAEATT